ncbi:sec23/Sec24 trunk domain-containing protein [Ditylenchus destructor]|nr:sec23/Sec24 trunk domain-containing protein [Ditylenchus destructor]
MCFVEQLLKDIDTMPGDERSLIGFMAVDANVHFFQFLETSSPPKHLIVYDINGILKILLGYIVVNILESYVPADNGLIVNVSDFKDVSLPTLFEFNSTSSNCLGAALNFGRDLIARTGGRITVMLASIPNVKTQNLSPTTDFYKRLALECDAKAICVDLFALSEKHQDIASLSDISKFTGGSVYHFPHYHLIRNQTEVKRFQRILSRYLTRKLGLEAVLRIRYSRGISICAFYGNSFVRSTDLISLANVNPGELTHKLTPTLRLYFQDSTIGIELRIDQSLTNQEAVLFQAALLYSTTTGERRIRLHTLCLPVVNEVSRIFNSVDIKATTSLLAKMDLPECRDIILNTLIDVFKAYNNSMGHHPTSLLVPIQGHLKYFPLFVQGLLKHRAFSNAVKPKISVDERVSSMMLFFYASIEMTMLEVYPALYAVHNINQETLKPLDNPISILLHEFLAELFYARGRSFAPLLIIREDSLHKDLFTRRLVDDQTDASDSFVEFLQYLKRKVSSS